MTATTTTKKTIDHVCGHSTTVEVDASTKPWTKHYQIQPCFQCQPTATVTRICGHEETIERGFYSPRRLESAAMQCCKGCQ